MRPRQDIVLWTLAKNGKAAAAVLRHVEGFGYEVRLMAGDELRQSRAFRSGDTPGADAQQWAEAWRKDLEGQGWVDATKR